jgi:DNA-binding GntR family transcriptional regulator
MTTTTKALILMIETHHIPAAQQAYNVLHDSILGLKIKPGQSVSEKEISTRIGVSRQPVREAFIRLSHEGLLNIRPQIGTFVTRLNVAQINEAAFIRVALECAAVRESIQKATKADIKKLHRIIESHQRANEDGDFDQVYIYDSAFHIKLFEISCYPGVWKMVNQARSYMLRLRSLSVVNMTYSVARSIEYHTQILTYIEKGDGEAAALSMKKHIESNVTYMERLIEEMPDYFET